MKRSTKIGLWKPQPGSYLAWCAAFAFALVAVFVAPVSGAGLVARYTLAGDLLDSSGNNSNGTFQGTGGANAAATFVADAKFGTVMDFDGTDDRVLLGPLFTLQNSSWSLSLWVKTPANANRIPLVGKNNGDNGFSVGERVVEITGSGTWGNIIDPEPAGNLAVNGHSMGGVVTYQSLISLDDGAWHMVTMVHDNGVSATDMTLYIDGVVQPKGSQTFNNNQRADAGDVYIGFANASGSGAGGYLAGQMALVHFYDVAISQLDVTALFVTQDPYLLAPTSVSLDSTYLTAGAVTRSVEIVNTGRNQTLNISNVTFTGPDAGLFTNPVFPATLAPGASNNVAFTFTPAAVGTFNATMTIASDSQGSPTTDIGLQIVVVPDPFLVAPASVVLNGTGLPAGAVARSISISNNGPSQTLNISNVTFTGPDQALFTAPVFPASIAPSAGDAIAFTFTPTTAGSFTATMEITSDSVGAPITSVNLQIDVVNDPFLAAPASVMLDPTKIPRPPAVGSINFTNTGLALDLNISNVTFTGSGAAIFSNPVFPTAVAPGASDTIQFTISPTAVGSFSATMEITSDSMGTPVTSVALQIDVAQGSTLPGGLVAYWSFDSDTSDWTGNHDGILTNGAAISSGGMGFGGGEALTLGGGTAFAAAYMSAANPTTLDFNSDFTWHAYLKTAGSVGGIFSRSQVAADWNQGSKCLFLQGARVELDAGWIGQPNSQVTVNDDAWHQVIVTYVAVSDTLNVFIDPAPGTVNGQISQVFDLNRYDEHTHVHLGGTADADFRIGMVAPNFESGGFVGLIDEAAVFDQALTGADLDQLITNGPAAFLTMADVRPLAIGTDGTNLLFSWESKAGEVFNLLGDEDLAPSDPSQWAPFQAGIAATPPTNTLVVSYPSVTKMFFVLKNLGVPPRFEDDFETDKGWTVGSDGAAGTAWERGTPANVGPAAANSPTQCYGSNIGANYATNANIWLRSPAIDLTAAGIVSATLTFQQYYDIEQTFDWGTVRVLDAAADTPLGAELASRIEGTSPGWESFSAALPPEALGKTIKIEFRFQSDNLENFAGWYIDDVRVTTK